MEPFIPKKIIVEEAVRDIPRTQRILQRYSKTPTDFVVDYREWKEPVPISSAKRVLALVQHRGQVLKPFPKIKNAVNLGDYVFNPVSNCYLECTYCILQSYLKNNPLITVFPDWDRFFDEIMEKVQSDPQRIFRLGTGELSDSLAFEELTQFSREWVPFFSKLPNAYLELKTKTNCIENLLDLDHRGHTVLSWSLAPDTVSQREEHKCARLEDRLTSAARAQEAGYPIGLHLDPLVHFEEWEEGYTDLIQKMAESLDPGRIAWVSVGSLRFDKALKDVATQRFPKTKIFSGDFVASPDGKMRYFKTLRIQMFQAIWSRLKDWSDQFPRYLCMEPPWVWEKVTQEPAPRPEWMEDRLVQRLVRLQGQFS